MPRTHNPNAKICFCDECEATLREKNEHNKMTLWIVAGYFAVVLVFVIGAYCATHA